MRSGTSYRFIHGIRDPFEAVLTHTARGLRTILYVRPTLTRLLRAVPYVLVAQGSRYPTVRTEYAYEPRACRTYRVPWDHRFEVVISGYQYHLRTTERWAKVDDERWNGTSYQKHLNQLPLHRH